MDAGGRPVSGALVKLMEGNRIIGSVSSDGQGLFKLRTATAGELTVRAEAPGHQSNSLTLDGSTTLGTGKPLVLTLRAADAASMDYADGSNFVISGVTDWTAVGGHGSDATLRTSEDLARTTSMLKVSGPKPEAAEPELAAKLKQKLETNPGGKEENRQLGEYYLRTGAAAQALRYLKIAVAGGPEDAVIEHDLAEGYRQVGEPREALDHAIAALKQAATAENYEVLGGLQESLGESFDAVQNLQRAAQLGPTEQRFFAWASELLLHRAVWQAADVFQRGSRLYPASLRMRVGWASALFGEARYVEAAQQLCKASDLAPFDEEPYRILGQVDQASPTKLACVQEKLLRYVRSRAGSPTATYNYAMTLIRWGTAADQLQARALLMQTIHLQPQHAGALLQLGIMALNRLQYQQAIDFLARCIAADPDDPESHFRLAMAYEHTGQAAAAQNERNRYDALKGMQAGRVEAERRAIKQFIVQATDHPPSN